MFADISWMNKNDIMHIDSKTQSAFTNGITFFFIYTEQKYKRPM